MSAKTDTTPAIPKLIDWTCGFCGHTESDEIWLTEAGGCRNTKTVWPKP